MLFYFMVKKDFLSRIHYLNLKIVATGNLIAPTSAIKLVDENLR